MADYDLHMGELYGYRVFTIDVDGVVLHSVGIGDYAWKPGPNRARCTEVTAPRRRKVWVNDPNDPEGLVQADETVTEHGRIPSWVCDCGFWIVKTEALCREKFFGLDWMNARWDMVIGRVRFWGRAIEHDEGYRAEHARITAIVTDDPESYGAVLDHYRIPAIAPTPAMQAFVSNVTTDTVRLVSAEDFADLGWFEVASGVELPEPGRAVMVEHQDRVITAIYVEPEEED